MTDLFESLVTLGAADVAHLDGSLLAHLTGTSRLLQAWGARDALVKAGLYHAVYGTDGFPLSLIDSRETVISLLGEEAESIVYHYGCCDRDDLWHQFGKHKSVTFRDRFTGNAYTLTHQTTKDFCELTVANEIEIATDNPAFLEKYGDELVQTFEHMGDFLSTEAIAHSRQVLNH